MARGGEDSRYGEQPHRNVSDLTVFLLLLPPPPTGPIWRVSHFHLVCQFTSLLLQRAQAGSKRKASKSTLFLGRWSFVGTKEVETDKVEAPSEFDPTEPHTKQKETM